METSFTSGRYHFAAFHLHYHRPIGIQRISAVAHAFRNVESNVRSDFMKDHGLQSGFTLLEMMIVLSLSLIHI